eukprot:symbB.v1.2.036177.t1/scaffold5047.1/size31493/1
MNLPGVPVESRVRSILDSPGELRIDHQRFPKQTFEDLRNMVLQYVEEFMLSHRRASDLQIATPRVFIQSKSTLEKPVDYLRELLVIGLLELGLEVFVNCNVDYIFEDFDVDRQGETWKTSYGRGFLYERSLDIGVKDRLHFWTFDMPLPEEPFTYIKTTYNNQQFPLENLLLRDADIMVDGNDIWAPHPEAASSGSSPVWFQRELTGCHELETPAQLVMSTLDSGDLWMCDQVPGSHLCPDLHHSARLWYQGLKQVPSLQALRGYRYQEKHEEIMGDIEDYLMTPPGHPEFVEKYVAIATNSRQFMDAFRRVMIQTDRSASAAIYMTGPRRLLSTDPVMRAATLAACAMGKYDIEDSCHWGSPIHGLLAVLHVLNPSSGSDVWGNVDTLRGCLAYGLRAAEATKLLAEPPLSLEELPEVLFPSPEEATAAVASAMALLNTTSESALLLNRLTEIWSHFCQVLQSLEIEDFELKAWLQEMAVITPSTGWPWWRMVQKSGQMRYQRRGLLEQVASLKR